MNVIPKWFANLKGKFDPVLLSISIVLVPQLLWISRDHSVWGQDQSFYAQSATDIAYNLKRMNPHWWLALMLGSTPSKPPLINWINQGSALFLWSKVDIQFVMLLTSVGFLYLSCLQLNSIGKILNQNKLIRLTSPLLLLSSPLVLGISHQYFVENLQLLIILSVIKYWLIFPRYPYNRLREILYLIFMGCLLALSKIDSILLVLPFIVSILFKLKYFLKTNNKEFKFKFFPSYFWQVPTILLTIGWYIRNFNHAVYHAWFSTRDSSPWATKLGLLSQIQFWTTNIFKDFVGFFVWLLVVAACWLIHRIRKGDSAVTFTATQLAFRKLLVTSLVFDLVVLIIANNSDHRFLYPIFGLASLCIFCISFRVPSKIFIAYSICLITLFSVFESYSLGAPLRITRSWLIQVNSSNQDQNSINGIILSKCNDGSSNSKIYIDYENPIMNQTTWEYFLARLRYKNRVPWGCSIVTNSFGENSLLHAIKNFQTIRPTHFVSISDYFSPKSVDHNVFNKTVDQQLLKYLESSKQLKNGMIVNGNWFVSDVAWQK